MGAAVPVAYFWHTEAPRNLSPHSESGGRTWPAPPPKATADPFFCHFSGGRTWGPDLRAVIFGRGCARGLFLAHGRPSQCLAPFRFRRKNMASPTPQGYSPPLFLAIFWRTNLGTRPSGGHFWVRLRPWPIFGSRMPLAKSRPIPSPAGDLGQPHTPRLLPNPFFGLFPADELGDPTFGRSFLGAAVPVAYFWPRRPLAKSRPIPSPADELGQPHPPRL